MHNYASECIVMLFLARVAQLMRDLILLIYK
jgi:hypothetical protein